MSPKVSRRTIARLVAGKLLDGQTDPKSVMHALAAYLVENRLADDADVLINDIAEELFAQSGKLTTEVVSAHALDETVRNSLRDYLKHETGAATVELYESIDEDLIGGLVVRTPAAELDASIRSRLRQLTAIAN